jgi:cysteine desulfurase/selenocysteine lyase
MSEFPVGKIREDFPVLSREVYGKPLIYFDNGATTQKPVQVIEVINQFHREHNASIHRSVNFLSDTITASYEEARVTTQRFLNATKPSEIIFTSGATASINLVAFSFGETYIHPGDEVILSTLEHHSNIVPWQMMCERKGASIKVIPISDQGELDLEAFAQLFNKRTRIVAVTHVSNVLGTINPVEEIVKISHSNGVPVLIDGAQAIPHGPVDVQKIDCDFYAFSGHKVYGPTGTGVLYGKEKWLETLPPWQGGGDMIDRVTFDKTTYNELPLKFEAGTTNFIGIIGLAAALEYLKSISIKEIESSEKHIVTYASNALQQIDGLKLFGPTGHKAPVFSFILNQIHPYDTGVIIDKLGIAVRTGTHCAMPLMDRLGVDGTVRASLCFYNTTEEIDRLVEALDVFNTMLS